MEMYDVFISYRRSDGQAVADDLYNYLTAKGLRVFLDREKLKKGDTFPEQLRENILNAPNYILIATNDVFKFREGIDWVRDEIELAVQNYKTHRMDKTITTLVLEDTIFPEKLNLPECVHGIDEVERIVLPINTTEDYYFSDKLEEAFVEVFETVTKITSGNLWNAAHRWLEESKKEKGRFSKLNICESILPNVELKSQNVEIPILVSQDKEESKPLFKAIEESESHLYLIGQGGIGKTTALMHIMNQEYVNGKYEKGKQIPIFVELSFAPDTFGALYKTDISSFIRRSVYRQIRTDLKVKQVSFSVIDELDEIFTIAPEVAVKPVTDIFSKQAPAPEYLLLLDGLNEVSTVRLPECKKTILQMVTEEIQYLMNECPNVRVVLTSRSDEIDMGSSKVTKLYLEGIDDHAIRRYLSDSEVLQEKIEKIYENQSLIETLRIPLFLTMYVSLSEENEAVTQGEILRLFFSERRKNIDMYTNQNRLDMLEENLHNAANEIQVNRITADMFHFMLDFVLPEIAWYMERSGKFYLSIKDICEKVVKPLLFNVESTDIGGYYGREVFDKYSQMGYADEDVYSTITGIKSIMGGADGSDFIKITKSIMSCCIVNLGILQKSNKRYGFVHQHIRDFFAAVKNINTIRMAVYMHEEEETELALECMNLSFYDEPVNLIVRRFMGEYLGEHRNKPYFKNNNELCYSVPKEECDRNLIDRVLDVYRGYFENEGGYGLYSLLKILNEMRGSLAGSDFSELDLTKCSLNGVCLSEYGLSAKMINTKINGDNLFFAAHKDAVRMMHICADGTRLITLGNDKSVCVWNIKSGAIIKRAKIEEEIRFPSYTFIQDGEKILITRPVRGKIKAFIWDLETEKMEKELDLDIKAMSSKMIHPDGNSMLFCDSNQVHMWSFDEEKPVCICDGFECNESMPGCTYWDDEKKIVLFSKTDEGDEVENELFFIDVKTKKVVQHSKFLPQYHINEMVCFGNKMCAILKERGSEKYVLSFRLYEDDTWHIFDEVYSEGQVGKMLHDIKFSDCGRWLAVVERNRVKLFDGSTLHWVKTIENNNSVSNVVFNDAQDKFIILTYNGTIIEYDTNYFEIALNICGENAKFADMCSFSLNNHFITYNTDGVLYIWNAEKKSLALKKNVNINHGKLEFNKIKNQLCVTSSSANNSLLYVFELPDFTEIFAGKGKGSFSNDGNSLHVRDWEKQEILIYDTKNYAPVFRIISEDELLVQIGEIIILKFYPKLTDEEIFEISFGNKVQQFLYRIYDTREDSIISVWDVELEIVSTFDNKIELLLENGNRYLYDIEIGDWVSDADVLPFVDKKVVWSNSDIPLNTITKNDIQIRCQEEENRADRIIVISDVENIMNQYEVHVDYFKAKCVLNNDENEIAIMEDDKHIGLYSMNCIENEVVVQKKWEIISEAGLDLIGLDLRKLHPDSVFTEEQYEILRTYGAIVG